MKKSLFLLLIVTIVGCKQKEQAPKIDTELNELFGLMQGSFNSEIQAKADSTYYNISLHMYPIWKDKGNYLYVEQALNSMQNRPYRQRIYEVTRASDSTFKSAIYTLPSDSLWIGKWKTPLAFVSIAPTSIKIRKGCEVILKRLGDNHFKGSTGERSCESSLRGASFATSEVEITSEKVLSWDRGFDSIGNHVWGATKGAYIFNKLN
ncbi:chromophore lyase CpcT/CpeT [Seonamhaeicola marinus]|uniref:chromophore lyase CpcT/CpeT n=1 Tax=Seonamhaeicola marinus TaxID=1912246 RepID=UPI001651D5DD|nr:chromophore lyase CpcT/CpeT [Seonamhaeicola marinus]